MATYYASQAGAGLADGTSVDNAWAAASIVWSTVGNAGQGGNTLYFLDAITSVITPSFNGDGVEGNPTVVRGDYPDRTATISTANGIGITTNTRDYMHFRNLTFVGATTNAGLQITGASAGIEIYNCNFNSSIGIYINGGDYAKVYNNVFTRDATSGGYGIRIFGVAEGNQVYNNTFTCSDKTLTNFGTAIHIDSATATRNIIYANEIYDMNGDGIAIFTDAHHNTVTGNILSGSLKDGITIEDAYNNTIVHNYVSMDGYYGDSYPCLKLGDDFGSGSPSDYNTIVNNIFEATSAVLRIGALGGNTQSMGQNNIIDNNIWNHIDSTGATLSFHVDDGVVNTAYTFSGIQALGYETNGFYIDPELNSDRTPSYIGPCYRAGKPLGFAAKDANGHKFKNPPTIGAYELAASRMPAKAGRNW